MFLPLKDENPSDGKPIVTISLIAVNVAIFAFMYLSGGEFYSAVVYEFGMTPAYLGAATLHTLFTSMFLHGGIIHLAGNMLYLWIFGDNIESICGKTKFILFYLTCGLIASFTHLLTTVNPEIPTIGASGAIAGVLGAYLLIYPRAKVLTLVFFFFITMIRVPAVVLLGFWFVYQLFLGSVTLMSGVGTGVAFWAHIGGFAAGFVLILLFRKMKPRGAII